MVIVFRCGNGAIVSGDGVLVIDNGELISESELVIGDGVLLIGEGELISESELVIGNGVLVIGEEPRMVVDKVEVGT